jgi:two-component system response regulator YesN
VISVLIVDDEKNIRAGIRKILAESVEWKLDCVEAKNGEEALGVIDARRIDLMITDIRMPKMDGIELMRTLASRERAPAIIVLSGFDEFSYAREAIRAGAVSYILKPVDRNELIGVVTETIASIEKRNKGDAEKAIRKVMAEGRVGRGVAIGDFSVDEPFFFAVVTGPKAEEAVNDVSARHTCFIVERQGGNVLALLRGDGLDALCAFAESAEDVCVGSSGVCSSLGNLRTAWHQALIASYNRFFVTGKNAFRFEESGEAFDRGGFNSLVLKLTALIGSGDQDAIASCLAEIFSFDGVAPKDRPNFFFSLHEYVGAGIVRKYWEYTDSDMYLNLKALMIENVGAFGSIDDYRKAVLDFVLYLDSILRKKRVEYPFVAEAIGFLGEHFREDINMSVVANHVSVNYTYFSEKFKEHTGVNFNDYLKRLRIEEAKRGLEKGCYKVYEVATNSGFGDVKHFTKTFKEITGVSPGEYRKRF